MMDLAVLTAHLRDAMRPEWLEPAYSRRWTPENPTQGFCSIAAEAAFFVLGGGPAGWVSWATRDTDGTSHWWLQYGDGTRYDPTAEQFTSVGTVPPYERGLHGRPCGFMGMRSDEGNAWGFDRRPGRRATLMLAALVAQWSDPAAAGGDRVTQVRQALLPQAFTRPSRPRHP